MDELINGCKSIVLRCRSCGRLKKYKLNIFNIYNFNLKEYKCNCGETNIRAEYLNNKVRVKTSCFYCNGIHNFILDLGEILKQENTLYCTFGRRLCFMGSSNKANQILLENQISLLENQNIIFGEDYFHNFIILEKVLERLNYLNREGKISCDCGKTEIDIQLFFDRLELKCNSCHSVKIIFAETEEDLSIIMNKDKIVLREHNISCIDSIMEKKRDI